MKTPDVDVKPVLEFSYHTRDFVESRFFYEIIKDGSAYPECRSFKWPTDATKFGAPEGFDCLLLHVGSDSECALLRHESALINARLSDGAVSVDIAGQEAQINAALELLHRRFPKKAPKKEHVDYTFWMWNLHSNSLYRSLQVPSWRAIRPNYATATASALDLLMRSRKGRLSGQLILWHGEPGTGKTFALRALSSEWMSWCNFEYVIDPETFFSDARYMMKVLLSSDDSDEYFDMLGGPKSIEKWRALILEDTGELLAADAKERTGQGLSRLLNVADGLLGQGLRVLFVITTNEPIRALHPAIGRPGRAAVDVEFKPFSHKEAAEWARRNGGFELPDRTSFSLAELYALKEGSELPAGRQRPVGFVA